MESTNPGTILQRMGIEMSPDDPRSAEQVLNELNRKRIEANSIMGPNPDIKLRMAEFALRNYPLTSDQGILESNE